MNVNLVSPTDNGNNYTVRFKEDIVIPQNSKVYLNFASLSRENDVELYEDQEITLLFNNDDIRPHLLPNRVGSLFDKNNVMFKKSFTIPKGTYNYQKLYTNITTGINGLLTDPLNEADLSMYRAVALSDIDNTDAQITQGQVSFSLGLMKNYIANVPHRDFDIDTANTRNCNDNGTNGYQKTTANAVGASGLMKSNVAGGGAFNGDDTSGYTEGNISMTAVGSVVGQELQAQTGTGTGATIDFDIVSGGRLKMTNGAFSGIGNSFDASGANTPTKTAGNYTSIPLNGGTGSGALINFTVAVGGAITFSTIVIADTGAGYAIGDKLTIDNTATGGTADSIVDVKTLRIGIDYTTIRVNAIGDGYAVGDRLKISNLVPNTLGGSVHNLIDVQTLQNSAGVPFYDNYALSQRHYWHIGYDDDTPFDNTNVVKFTTKNSGNDMQTSKLMTSIGFASSEVALGINRSDGAYPLNSGKRTGGVGATTSDGASPNPQNVPLSTSNSNPKSLVGFIMCEIGCTEAGANAFIKLKVAQHQTTSFNTNGLHTWDSCNKSIGAMKQLASVQLSTISGYDMSNPFQGGIQTYYDKNNLDDLKLYFRVLNLNGYVDGGKPINEQSMVLFDSRTAHPPCFFPDAFFRCQDPAIIDYGTTSNFPINDLNLKLTSNQGSPDKTTGQHNNINITTTTGTGTGLQISFAVGADNHINISSIVVNEGGDGYKVGDTCTIPSNQGVGGTPDTTLIIKELGMTKGANRINSQLPLNVIAGALKINDGFEHITAPFFTKHDAKPLTIINRYELEATDEISRYLNLHTSQDRIEGHSDFLHPNTGDAMNPNLIHLEGMNLDWRNESYSISLKELPIKNYKNTESKAQGGFGKTILANCPVPFSDAQSYMTKTKQMITATYKPNYQIISNLYNQAISTNHFSVEIRKLATDKPANEIKKSIVNFTIMPPDNYTGNINSVDLLKN